MSVAFIQVHFRLDFLQANNLKSDLTATLVTA